MPRLFSKKSHNDIPRRRQRDSSESRASQKSLDQRYAFKRNQTLTGSASSNVKTLSEEKAHLKSDRVVSHDLTKQRRHVGATLTLVVLSALSLFFLIYQFTASSTLVATPDSSLQLNKTYAKSIDAYFARQPIERFRFALNEQHLYDYASQISPEIKSIKVNGNAGFGVSAFTVAVRKPTAVWNIGGQQKFVDANGVAFSRNYFSTPTVSIEDNSGIQVTGNNPVASNRFLGFVGTVIGLSAKEKLSVTKVSIPSGTSRQIELRLKGVSYPTKLSVDRPAGEQVEDMARAITWMKREGNKPKYIDVRVSGKAYYR